MWTSGWFGTWAPGLPLCSNSVIPDGRAGECEQIGEKLGGIAVHIAARVSAAAGPGEVLVSQTVKDLVAGSGIAFEDRGLRELKGVPDPRRLYAVA